MEKIREWLQIVALVVGILSFIGLGLNQFASFIDAGREDKVAYNEALLGCIQQRAPHVIFIDNVPYCHMIYRGTELIAPLENLQKSNPQP